MKSKNLNLIAEARIYQHIFIFSDINSDQMSIYSIN